METDIGKIKDLDSFISNLKSEINKHQKTADDYRLLLANIKDQIERKARLENAIDVVKIATANRKPAPTFYCAKFESIQKQAKCSDQCNTCKVIYKIKSRENKIEDTI